MKPLRSSQHQAPCILRGARVVDPANETDEIRDLGMAEGIIVPPDSIAGAVSYNLHGRVVAPGFIDMHVHLRDPGQTHKEDVLTGTRAAAAGGFATGVAMPNTVPPIDSPAAMEFILARIDESAAVSVLQAAALTIGRAGRELADYAALRRAGAVALTDDGTCIQNARFMLAALAAARAAGLPVLEHCEEESLGHGGVVHEGEIARRLALPGQNRLTEELIVARDILMARETGWPVHLQHLSSAGSVAQVRAARAAGVAVTAEATPHHVCLTEEACLEHGTTVKVNPPLRTATDRDAIIQGLADDTITVLATDHAPHTAEEKSTGFRDAPFGLVGLESAVPVCLTALYHSGRLGLSQLVAKFTAGPKAVLRLSSGSLEPGAPADVTVLDLDAETVVDVRRFRSRARNCPFDGWRCRGRAVAVAVAGRWVYSELPGVTGLIDSASR